MTSYLLKSNFDKELPTISHGKGSTLYDTKGKDYIDGSSGAIVANIGHGVNLIAEAAARQASQVSYTYRTQFKNQPAEELAAKLIELAEDKAQAFFLNSGSESTEAAIRIALQYWVERGKPSKRRILSRTISYHGNTLGALSLSSDSRRQAISDIVFSEPVVPAPYCYRCPLKLDVSSCNLKCATEFENQIETIGASNIAAFIVEPIIGATAGAVTPHVNYMKRIREICDRHDILLIADEVITGLGRTGKWFAMHHYGVSSDITVLGKGINAGYTTLSALLLNQRIVDAISDGTRKVSIGHTHSGNPFATAISLEVIKYIQANALVDKANANHSVFEERLLALKAKHSLIGDVRGMGMLWGIEFVANREQRTTFPIDAKVTDKIVDVAHGNGLIVYACRGLINAGKGDAILVCPPLVITETELETLFARLDKTIESVSRELAQ